MSQLNPAREQIVGWLAESLPLGREQIEGMLTAPPSAEMGDYALPCFALASALRRAPAQIARDLAGRFPVGQAVRKAVAAGPYLNLFVDRQVVTRHVLELVHRLGEGYGRSDGGAGGAVVIDYSSPNIAKHLAVHHVRSISIGRSLYRIFETLGYRCVGINHVGDWGTSFGKLIVAFESTDELDAETATVDDLQEAYVRVNQEIQADPSLEDEARRAFQRLESGEARAVALWKRFREVSLAEFEKLYGKMGVSFDGYSFESDCQKSVEAMLQRARGDGIAEESEGALIVKLDKYDMPPCMLQKSDSTSLYASRDICAAEQRWDEHHFEHAFYVVGGEQKLYFRQLRRALELMGHPWADRIEHVDFGLIKMLDAESGYGSKASSRTGDIVLLEDVLTEAIDRARQKIQENLDRFEEGADVEGMAAQVGLGAVVFSDLCVRRSKDVTFDWDRMLDFEGDTGPYVQYAHARVSSILRKAGQEAEPGADFSLLSLPEEWALVRLVEDFPARIQAAAENREPSVIANYLLELCALFSTYYSAGMRQPQRRVLCDDAETRAARLLLVSAVRHVIRSGLWLLGMDAPERM